MGLTLPTEAQWENGTRAGTQTPWWTGLERESLREMHVANLADQAAGRADEQWQDIASWPELDDGDAVHAPVGTFTPNPFGLHEVHGNVWEWCLDGRGDELVIRGGGFNCAANSARSAYRYATANTGTGYFLGVRPAREVTED